MTSNDSSTTPRLWHDQQLVTLEQLAVEVRQEDCRQILKWGVQTHTPAEWFLILGEEIGELGQAMCATQWPDATPKETVAEHVRAEAIQVATLALKIAEMAEAHT